MPQTGRRETKTQHYQAKTLGRKPQKETTEKRTIKGKDHQETRLVLFHHSRLHRSNDQLGVFSLNEISKCCKTLLPQSNEHEHTLKPLQPLQHPAQPIVGGQTDRSQPETTDHYQPGLKDEMRA